MDIAAFAGSLRATSYNRGLLRAAAELAPVDVAIEILDLAAIPLFNQDLERTGLPETVANLRKRVRDADGLLIATPEYNHTIPGVLGNTIDWLTRRTRPARSAISQLRSWVRHVAVARSAHSRRCASPWSMRVLLS